MAQDLFFWLAAIGWVLLLLPIWFVLWPPRRIGDIEPVDDGPDLPLVSIIVAARDESEVVEQALEQLLSIDYPRLQIVAVDDRSTDGTGKIVDRICARDPRCEAVHIFELPPGWLGKNHANWVGASRARGELLLFTDGDVLFEPAILRHAIAAVRRFRLDHLVLFPRMPMASIGEEVAVGYFTLLFGVITRFPMARLSWARFAYVGVGAFNLIRRDAYEKIGTHLRLRLEVADDVELGRLVKWSGFSQMALSGHGLLSVKWHTGVWGIVRGLEKNAFAAVDYSVPKTTFLALAHVALLVVPIVLVVTGPARSAALLAVLATWATEVLVARGSGGRFQSAVLYPLGGLLFSFVLLRSMVITLHRGGVVWRDTFYPLDQLREHRDRSRARAAEAVDGQASHGVR
jgi:cellulose synthase/poly-beta-1,6-N-acetylglucosamine synthase-like glycosyltransferase